MPEIFNTYTLFVPKYAAVDYELASDIIIGKALKKESFGVSALAVHGLMTCMTDKKLAELIHHIDLIVPDGQPTRWALNSFYKLKLKDRVYGPTLTLHVLEKANQHQLKIFLFGSTENTLNKFKYFINKKFPLVEICGMHIDRFREASADEDVEDIQKINESGAHIVLVGRGCPRQEYWVANHKNKVHAAMLAVGAAFDFHAGTVKQAPKWMQDNGLEWLFRLFQEPRRLWKRYLITNTLFILTFLKYKIIYRRAF